MLYSVRPASNAVLMFLALESVQADLPVHCTRTQVAGDWEFTLSPTTPERNSCGHQKPDNQNNQPAASFVTSLGQTTSLKLSLENPDTLKTEDGATGTWTMIYDEGFEFTIDDMVYFAFSDFEILADKSNISHCDATKVGWYHDKARTRWGCYAGHKKAAPTPPPAPQVDRSSLSALQRFLLPSIGDEKESQAPSKTVAVDSMTNELEQMQTASGVPDHHDSRLAAMSNELEQLQLGSGPADGNTDTTYGSAGYDKPMAGEWQQSVADALNFMQLGWTASAYELFQGKTPRELNTYAGVRHNRPARKQRHTVAKRPSSFSAFLGISSRVEYGSEEDTVDWRNHDGKNWLTPVVEQGDCGSCYTISTVHMLTARNRILHRNPAEPSFSVSFPLYCSEYNQGCDGGYGFLQTKWSEDVGLIPEQCAPFSQGGSGCKAAMAKCDMGSKRYRATGHHYVGGYYGGSDADLIKTELMTNGPVVMSFEPKEDFMYYKNGVYKSGPNKIHQEWEQVDHAVLLIGMGEENGQRYWTMQNSWGTDWGENGYFRMARGVDESGCESIVVAAEVTEEESNSVLESVLSSM